MSTAELIGLICGLGVPMLGGFFYMGLQLGAIKGCIKALPSKKYVDEKTKEEVTDHREGCPAYRAETSAVSHPPHPAPWGHE